MIYVTFHGFSGKNSSGINNIYGYDETQTPPQEYKDLLRHVDSDKTEELRGMMLANGMLYVVSGSKDASFIYVFEPSTKHPGSFTKPKTFLSQSIAGIDHPFDIAMQSTGSDTQQWLVSNQDTNVVVSVTSQAPYTSGSAGNRSTYLNDLWTALQNQANPPSAAQEFGATTFIASACATSPLPQVVALPNGWGGICASIDKGKVQNSVRGVLLYQGVLYVADEVGNAVRLYDPATGTPWGATTVSTPVHLLGASGNVYVGSGNQVLFGKAAVPPSPPPPPTTSFANSPVPPFPPPPEDYGNSATLTLADMELGLPLEANDSSGKSKSVSVSGFCFDDQGTFYVALRTQQQIYRFVPGSGNPAALWVKLKDEPEFLLWMATPAGK